MRRTLDRCFAQYAAQSAVYQLATVGLNHPACSYHWLSFTRLIGVKLKTIGEPNLCLEVK